MISDFPVLISDFSAGFHSKKDPTDMPLGAAQSGQNVTITADGKIAPAKGAEIFGATDTAGLPVISTTNFKQAEGTEIPVRNSGTVLEYYHSGTAAWENLNSGYSTGQLFGFKEFNEGEEWQSYLYFCNDIEPYSRWTGAHTLLNGVLAGAETEIVVDSVLLDTVLESGTASSVTTTTLVISPATWSADLWDGFYIHITNGAQSGKISKISATTTSQVTFTTISGLSGTPTFEIRRPKFADSGTLRIGTTDVAYTSMDQADRFAGCTSTPAAADNAALAQAVTKYSANPRGNILQTHNGKMFLTSNRKTAVWVSAVADPTDFTYSATRAAGEGDLVLFVEGGGNITGTGVQEDSVYVVKEGVIKTLTYTQDALDLATTNTLIASPLVGAQYPLAVFKVDNFLYFASAKGGVKTAGRVADIDFVQTLQISDPIRKTVNLADFSSAAGIFFDERAFISAKKTSTSANNDIEFVYNFPLGAWELPRIGRNISSYFIYNDELYGGSSLNNETYKLETGRIIKTGDDPDEEQFPIKAVWESSSMTEDLPANLKAHTAIYLEGYISPNTTIKVYLQDGYKGLKRTLTGTITGTADQVIIAPTSAGLAVLPLAVGVLGAGTPGEVSGRNKFRLYLLVGEKGVYEHSIKLESDGVNQDWEILRIAYNTIALPIKIDPKLKKALN